jgi:hypothetical protein
MKRFKTILLGIAGLVLAHAATAATTIYIVGSNGDRSATNTAISNLLTANGNTFTVAYSVTPTGAAGSLTSSNWSTFTGTYSTGPNGNVSVVIKTAYIGAAGAIKAVAGNETVRFLPNGATGNTNVVPETASNPAQYEVHTPTFGTSTIFQETTDYTADNASGNYINLDSTLTGVVGLKFIGSNGFPAGSNLTIRAAQALWSRGVIPLAFITGSSGDRQKSVFAIGRNTDAGQRFGQLAEIGLGVNAKVKQFKPTISAGHVTSHVLWPRETISGVDSGFDGNSGYITGAELVAPLSAVLDSGAYTAGGVTGSTAGYYIGYVTPSDAANAITGGGQELKWNGVTYSTAAVQEGQYTAWLYTRVVTDPDLSGDAKDFADSLTANIISTAGATSQGILIGSLKVRRSVEGGALTATYF